MTETPEQRVARLEAELAQAKVTALQAQLGQARAAAGLPPPVARPEFLAQPDGFVRFAKPAPAPVADTRLAPAPREVPLAYRLVALPLSWWSLFALFMVTVAPIALWIAVPIAGVAAAAGTALVVIGLQLRRAARRSALLKWGQVARVVNAEVQSRGTYYSGTTVQNVRMAQAQGWQVRRSWYSGPVTRTRVDYELNGTAASLVLRGLDYTDGVILADQRDPRRALCVSSFPYDLDRDAAGNWTGRVATRAKVGSVVMILLVVGWTVGACWLWGAQA